MLSLVIMLSSSLLLGVAPVPQFTLSARVSGELQQKAPTGASAAAEAARARAEAARAARETARASATTEAARAREEAATKAMQACQTYVAFLTTLDKELAGIKVASTPADQVFMRAINLFGDEYFVPVLGKPLQSTTENERRDFILNVTRTGCPQLNPAEREVYRRWATLITPVFMSTQGTYGAAAVIAGLAERQQLREHARNVVQAPVPAATAGAFDALNKEIESAKVSFRKLWPREEQEVLQALTGRREKLAGSSPDAGKQVAIADASNGPEGTSSGGAPKRAEFVYIDAAMKNGANGNLEVMPVEEVFQWLYDAKFKCIRTEQVLWRGTEGQADSRQFGTKRFVIDCRGDCRDIHYRIKGSVHAEIFHYGLSKPVPVLHLRTVADLAYYDFTWIFTRGKGASEKPPVIRIHTWSSTSGDYGAGCTLD